MSDFTNPRVESVSDESQAQGDDQVVEETDASQLDNESDGSDGEAAASDESVMEPFSDYLPKIEQLLNDIGLGKFIVDPLQHGYQYENCVYALASLKDEREQYILRVPVSLSGHKFDDHRSPILNDVALLHLMAGHLAVPRVKAYSATLENALRKPFVVQTRLPGQNLGKIWRKLTHADKFNLIDQFVELLAKHEAITYATAGEFVAASTVPDSMNDFAPTAAPILKPFDEGDDEFMKDPAVLKDRTGVDIKALLVSHLNGWIAADIKKEGDDGGILAPKLRGLLDIVEGLDREGALAASQPVVLHQWSLEPRNIMVEQVDGIWRITSVVDWDEATANSRVLTRKPPSWIWDYEQEELDGYFDCDHHPHYLLNVENVELKELKRRFDEKAEAVLEGYLGDAYGHGRWLRRVWHLAEVEIPASEADMLDGLLEEWDQRWKPTMVESMPVPVVSVAELTISDESEKVSES